MMKHCSRPAAARRSVLGSRRSCREPITDPARSAGAENILTLTELEPLPCSGTSRLLSFDSARVTREQTQIAQFASICFVDLYERPRDRQAQRTSLSRRSAAFDVRANVIAAKRIGRCERLLDGRHERWAREVISQRASVDVPLARAGPKIDTAHRFLAAANRVNVLRVGHYFSSLSKVSGA